MLLMGFEVESVSSRNLSLNARLSRRRAEGMFPDQCFSSALFEGATIRNP